MEGEIVSPIPTVEQVDSAMLKRYLELVETANPDDLTKLMDSWAKYIQARKNSDVFEKGETAEEKMEREAQATIQEVMNG